MTTSLALTPPERLRFIEEARRVFIEGDETQAGLPRIEPWLSQSWQRCLAQGHQPRDRVSFAPVSRLAERMAADTHRMLRDAARPVIEQVSRAIADTRYFAILTDAQGMVIEVGALPGGHDEAARHARDIARIGVDLSEAAVGTTAIGAALAERRSVWLHRGEHFFHDTSIYSCAGAPVFDPGGDCIGMLDLTGVFAVERPELRDLAELSARRIEDAVLLSHACALLLRIGWPGQAPGGEGLVAIGEGHQVLGANAAARRMLNHPLTRRHPATCSDLFALPPSMLFDAARRGDASIEVPLWSGLRVQVRVQVQAHAPGARDGAARMPAPLPSALPASQGQPAPAPRLRDVQTALIHHAVDEARGNVAEAARRLGISRATVYRKLSRGKGRPG